MNSDALVIGVLVLVAVGAWWLGGRSEIAWQRRVRSEGWVNTGETRQEIAYVLNIGSMGLPQYHTVYRWTRAGAEDVWR